MSERPKQDDRGPDPDEVPSDEALDVEGPNESAPGHNPEPEEDASQLNDPT